ncbi:radical SAM protein [Bradymonas sediminis]|uniref:7-carboxy-7-deazaguanine synthase n=1 Tax=Bradymonas sediminis TaxID=1548548 RepID=A0A2Z4FP66_9DELT|nr:radical SAM protein [Bradymonas sediminis]AWV90743.1 7-carboxy-7-deazaguanine synthase [Bradymonas sediminis]TDP62614.1 7-carboxy-7-deazaguanine synthase [Bradymonas sediminis]
MTETTQLRLTEIFYSIQGESAAAGRPCVFVRLSRCNLRCTWCDTTYSFKGGDQSSFDAVLEEIAGYGCNLVEITGGEPLLQEAVLPFMTRLCDEGYEVLIETSGSLDISPIDDRVCVIMDFKAPGSGMVDKNLWSNVDALQSKDELKFVLLDRADFDWAVETCRERELFGRVKDVHFSPVHGVLDPSLLAEWILEEKLPVRLNLQVHKFLGVE